MQQVYFTPGGRVSPYRYIYTNNHQINAGDRVHVNNKPEEIYRVVGGVGGNDLMNPLVALEPIHLPSVRLHEQVQNLVYVPEEDVWTFNSSDDDDDDQEEM